MNPDNLIQTLSAFASIGMILIASGWLKAYLRGIACCCCCKN